MATLYEHDGFSITSVWSGEEKAPVVLLTLGPPNSPLTRGRRCTREEVAKVVDALENWLAQTMLADVQLARAAVDAVLHPNGRCMCAGEGRCDWCQRTNVAEKVIDAIADLTGVAPEEIKLDARLREDLGADSLDLVELLMKLEEAFEIDVSDDEAERLDTPGKIIAHIQQVVTTAPAPTTTEEKAS